MLTVWKGLPEERPEVILGEPSIRTVLLKPPEPHDDLLLSEVGLLDAELHVVRPKVVPGVHELELVLVDRVGPRLVRNEEHVVKLDLSHVDLQLADLLQLILVLWVPPGPEEKNVMSVLSIVYIYVSI